MSEKTNEQILQDVETKIVCEWQAMEERVFNQQKSAKGWTSQFDGDFCNIAPSFLDTTKDMPRIDFNISGIYFSVKATDLSDSVLIELERRTGWAELNSNFIGHFMAETIHLVWKQATKAILNDPLVVKAELDRETRKPSRKNKDLQRKTL